MRDYSFNNLLKNQDWSTEYAELVKFEDIDKKIIYELAINSRAPISLISKKVSLSRDGVKYRIERLIKAGAIQGFSAVINYSALGYKWYSVLFRMTDMFKDFEDGFEKYLRADPEILKVHKVSGRWDVYVDVICKSDSEFMVKFKKLKSFCEGHLQDFEILNVFDELDAHHVPISFFEKDSGKIDFPFGRVSQNQEHLKVDDVDLNILKILSRNARMPTVRIAEAVGLSADAVHNRVRRMSSDNLIKGYSLVFDPTSIGNSVHIVLVSLNSVSSVDEKAFVGHLIHHIHVDEVFRTGHKYDYVFYCQAKNPSEFNDVLMGVRTKFSDMIKDFVALSELREYKYTEFI